MIAKRIIPCLDVRDGRVVKGINFQGLKDVDDPVMLAEYYNKQGADELVFYDITASYEGRGLFTDVLQAVARRVFIPLTVGGAIRTLADFDRVLKCGADKDHNNAAEYPPVICLHPVKAGKPYGSQCVVLSMDIKRVGGEFHIFTKGGRVDTGIDALEWASRGESEGAGELVVNSMDTDGAKTGFDIPLLAAIARRVRIPIIASGGAGSIDDFISLFQLEGIDAGLAASIFHYRQVRIGELKTALHNKGIPVRL